MTFGVSDPHGRGREAVTLDANGDGLDDLFVTNEISSLFPSTSNLLFLNTGPGLVEWVDPSVTLSISSTCARALDFNDDGRTTSLSAPRRTVFPGEHRSWILRCPDGPGLASQAYRDVEVADFNGDGHETSWASSRQSSPSDSGAPPGRPGAPFRTPSTWVKAARSRGIC